MRSLNDVANPDIHDYIKKSQQNIEKISQSTNQSGRSNFLGNAKGKKPSRFNEDLESSATKSIAINDYLVAGKPSDRKIKVNLRTINNPAQREQLRRL